MGVWLCHGPVHACHRPGETQSNQEWGTFSYRPWHGSTSNSRLRLRKETVPIQPFPILVLSARLRAGAHTLPLSLCKSHVDLLQLLVGEEELSVESRNTGSSGRGHCLWSRMLGTLRNVWLVSVLCSSKPSLLPSPCFLSPPCWDKSIISLLFSGLVGAQCACAVPCSVIFNQIWASAERLLIEFTLHSLVVLPFSPLTPHWGPPYILSNQGQWGTEAVHSMLHNWVSRL